MQARKRRGNVLITAIFMAVFLFFLSVALISQNRMDISLGLSVDHRLKAESAARAGINYALRTMRTEPNWADVMQKNKPILESGAHYDVEVRGRSNPTGDPRLLIITSTGKSGIVSVQHWAVVEEVKKSHSGPSQLFSKAWNDETPPKPDDLAMLGSDYHWYDLGPLPAPDNTLEAGGGPLFVFAPEGSAQEPPSIIDALPFFSAETGLEVPGPLVRLEIVPPGRHLLRLEITKGEGEWKDIPDPGLQLGSSAGLPQIDSQYLKSLPVIRMWEDPKDIPDDRPPWDRRNVKISGKGDYSSGFEIFTLDSELGIWNEETGQYEKITTAKPYLDALANIKTPDELTLDWEKLTNTPLVYLEWYSLTGTALSANKDKIACQGLHTFYGHYPVAGERTWPDLGTPVYDTIVYQRPCVLEYDLKKEEWRTVVDLMDVPNKMSDPIIVRSPQWKEDFLEVDSKSRAFITAKKQGGLTSLLRFDDEDRFENLGQVPGEEARVVVFDDKPYYLTGVEPWPDSSVMRKGLRGFNSDLLDPQDIGGFIPAVSAMVTEAGKETEEQLKPKEEITLGLVGDGKFDITTHGKDLVALGFLRRDVEDLPFPQRGDYNDRKDVDMIKPKTVVTFFRYDGLGWQTWPDGTDNLLKSLEKSDDPERLSMPTLTEKKIELAPFGIALGSYVDGYPDLRRYGVLAAGKDKPPKLKGFDSD